MNPGQAKLASFEGPQKMGPQKLGIELKNPKESLKNPHLIPKESKVSKRID